MSNKYLVIKLTGNWIDNEQITGRLKFVLQDVPCAEVLENAVVECNASKLLTEEQLQAVNDEKSYKEFIKKHISAEFGDFFLGQGLINFVEKKDKFTTQIIGSVFVITDGAKMKGGE